MRVVIVDGLVLRQISYLSTAREEYDDAALARILAVSRPNNEARGLTGILAYGGGVFFQVLEGPSEDIDALLAILARDPRHYGLKVLDDREIDTRDFAEWSMAYATLDPESALQGREGFIDAQGIPELVARLQSPLVATFLKRFANER